MSTTTSPDPAGRGRHAGSRRACAPALPSNAGRARRDTARRRAVEERLERRGRESAVQCRRWGNGSFDINAKGHVVVRPDKERADRTLDLCELACDLEAQGVFLPCCSASRHLRSRIEALNSRFRAAMDEFTYTGGYTTVYRSR